MPYFFTDLWFVTPCVAQLHAGPVWRVSVLGLFAAILLINPLRALAQTAERRTHRAATMASPRGNKLATEENNILALLQTNEDQIKRHNANPPDDTDPRAVDDFNRTADTLNAERKRLKERLAAIRKTQVAANGKPDKTKQERVASRWAEGSKPPDAIRKAVDATLNDPRWPNDVRKTIARVALVWKPNVPAELAYSVYLLNERSLAIGPYFRELTREQSSELVCFEFGKLVLENADRASNEIARAFNQKFSGTIPDQFQRLPHVNVTDLDRYAEFAFVYYYFLFDRPTLRSQGLGELADYWERHPPHRVLARAGNSGER